jgi:hypothetical protein
MELLTLRTKLSRILFYDIVDMPVKRIDAFPSHKLSKITFPLKSATSTVPLKKIIAPGTGSFRRQGHDMCLQECYLFPRNSPETVTPPPPRSPQLNLDESAQSSFDSNQTPSSPTTHPDLAAARKIFQPSEINFNIFLIHHFDINPK